MREIVVDTSVAVKWFIREKDSEKALEVLHKLNNFYVPDFFLVEIDSALSKKVRRRDLTIKDAFERRQKFRDLPYKLVAYKYIGEFAFRLATEFSITLYDASYLATAIDYEAILYTADLRLFNGMSTTPFAKYIEYIGS